MSEKYFFDIPIYRCPIEKHTGEMEKEKQRLLDLGVQNGNEIPESYASDVKRYFHNWVWYPWRYNEIIGWIRLYVLKQQIRGEYWFIRAKLIRKNSRRKGIYHSGKAFECDFHPDQPAAKIYEEICCELERLSNEEPFKGRYLDLEAFHNIGPFVNWRQLMGFDTKQVKA